MGFVDEAPLILHLRTKYLILIVEFLICAFKRTVKEHLFEFFNLESRILKMKFRSPYCGWWDTNRGAPPWSRLLTGSHRPLFGGNL